MAAEVNDDGEWLFSASARRRNGFIAPKFCFPSHLTTTRVDRGRRQVTLYSSPCPPRSDLDTRPPTNLIRSSSLRSPLYAKTESPTLRYGWKALDDEPRIRHVVGNCIHLRHRHAPIRREILSHLFVRRGEPLTMSTPGCVELNQYRVGGAFGPVTKRSKDLATTIF